MTKITTNKNVNRNKIIIKKKNNKTVPAYGNIQYAEHLRMSSKRSGCELGQGGVSSSHSLAPPLPAFRAVRYFACLLHNQQTPILFQLGRKRGTYNRVKTLDVYNVLIL